MGECLLAALLGFISGSFAGVVIYRWPRSESLVYPRSQCDYCRTPLCWLDLLPVVSYVLLRGRCRYCSRPISPLYPGTELLMAVLYAVLVFYCQLSPGFYWGMIWTWGLVVAGIIDWQTGYIPDFISWGGIIISLGKAAWEAYLPEAVAAMLCLGGLLALLYLFSKGGLGWGDVKLLAAVGAVLGLYQGVIALMIAVIAGGIWASWLLISGRGTLKTAVPFAPFLALGGYVSYLNIVTGWY